MFREPQDPTNPVPSSSHTVSLRRGTQMCRRPWAKPQPSVHSSMKIIIMIKKKKLQTRGWVSQGCGASSYFKTSAFKATGGHVIVLNSLQTVLHSEQNKNTAYFSFKGRTHLQKVESGFFCFVLTHMYKKIQCKSRDALTEILGHYCHWCLQCLWLGYILVQVNCRLKSHLRSVFLPLPVMCIILAPMSAIGQTCINQPTKIKNIKFGLYAFNGWHFSTMFRKSPWSLSLSVECRQSTVYAVKLFERNPI